MPTEPAAQWGPMAATSAPAHLATRAATAEVTWTSAGWAEGPAVMVASASTCPAPSAASAQLATQGHCVRTPQCPVLPHRAVMGAPVDRVVISPMTVPAFLVRELFSREAAGVGEQQASLAVTILASSPVLGFEGQNCEVNVDDCPGHRCLNGGTCVDGVNTYNCQCPPEWTGGHQG